MIQFVCDTVASRWPLTSYDSGYEYSLEHWLELQQLVCVFDLAKVSCANQTEFEAFNETLPVSALSERAARASVLPQFAISASANGEEKSVGGLLTYLCGTVRDNTPAAMPFSTCIRRSPSPRTKARSRWRSPWHVW
jgi:hypothetical protein